MARLPKFDFLSLDNPDQDVIKSIMASRRNGLAGPFSALAHNPRVAGAVDRLHNTFRLQGVLEKRLAELIICIVAAEYRSEYAFELHARIAAEAGIPEIVLVALRKQHLPIFEISEETLLYRITKELLTSRGIRQPLYDQAYAQFGAATMVEIVAIVGFYSLLCLIINSFGINAAGEM